MTVGEIEKSLLCRAPLEMAEEWDNVGLMVGDRTADVHTVVVGLDVTEELIQTAIDKNAELILTHHPLIFHPLKSITENSLVYRLIAAGISVISLHTNLDKAAGGVNDTLAALLGLLDVTTAPDGMCRIGMPASPMDCEAFATHVAKTLGTTVRANTIQNKQVHRVALCGGSGADLLLPLCNEVDALVTGEIRHHEWLELCAMGVTAVEAGHHATEVCVVDTVATWLREVNPTLNVVVCKGSEPYRYIR